MKKGSSLDNSFPPLFPSSGWMHAFLREFVGKSAEGSASEFDATPREYARFVILDSNERPLVLSAAVEGGARRLRRWEGIDDLKLSDHGDWKRIHLGALEACLGRKPYYQFLEPGLKTVYGRKDILTLKDFNIAILRQLLSFIIGELDPEDLVKSLENEAVEARGKEIAENMKPEISSLEYIVRYGKESLLGFLFLDSQNSLKTQKSV